MSFDLTNKVAADVVSSSSPARSAPQSNAAGRNISPSTGGQGVRQNTPVNGNNVPVAISVPVTEPVNGAELSDAVSRLNDHVQNISRNLEFTIDEELNRVIITVYDSESEEVIRQIPAEEVLAIARHLHELENEGVIMNAEA